jgi:hypothetical protein
MFKVYMMFCYVFVLYIYSEMIAAVTLVNISLPHIGIIFCVVRNFKIYSFTEL